MDRAKAACGAFARHQLRRRAPKARLWRPAQSPAATLAGVFPGLVEGDARPALDGQLELDARGSEVHERAGVVERQVIVGAGAELLEALRVGAVDPARGVHSDRL